MAKEPTSLEHTMQQQRRSGGSERRASLERSVTPSDIPEDEMEEPSPEEDALPLPGQARQPDRNRLPSRDARQQSIRKITEPNENQSRINRPAPLTALDGVGGAPAINTQHTSQPTVYPSESEASLPGDIKEDSPRVNATRPSGRHPDTLLTRPPQSNSGLLTPQAGHNGRGKHTNTDSASRPSGILGKPQLPQTASSAGKARMMSEDQSPATPRQPAGHQYNPASQPPENMLAASDPDSHQRTTGSTSARAATNDAALHDAGRQQPSPPLGGDKSAGTQSYPLHGSQQPMWDDDAFQQPQMPNAPIKKDPQDHRDPPSQEQQGHASGQGVQKPRKDQQKSDSIPNNISTTDPGETRPSPSSKVDPRPKSPAPGAAGAGFNENRATTTPATKHRTKKDPQETVPPSPKGTQENKTSDTGIFKGDEQLQAPVSANRPDLNHRGGLGSSAPGAGTKATDYATVDAHGKGYDLIEEDAQLQVISEEICSTILEGELSGMLEKALKSRLLSAFSTLPRWRQDELCREAVEQATAELSEFVDAVVGAQTDS